jgi:hypothetical protein
MPDPRRQLRTMIPDTKHTGTPAPEGGDFSVHGVFNLISCTGCMNAPGLAFFFEKGLVRGIQSLQNFVSPACSGLWIVQTSSG